MYIVSGCISAFVYGKRERERVRYVERRRKVGLLSLGLKARDVCDGVCAAEDGGENFWILLGRAGEVWILGFMAVLFLKFAEKLERVRAACLRGVICTPYLVINFSKERTI